MPPTNLTIQFSTRQVKRLNNNDPVIIYPNEVDFAIHFKKKSQTLETDDSVHLSVSEYMLDELNKGKVARMTTIDSDRLSTLTLEPEVVIERV